MVVELKSVKTGKGISFVEGSVGNVVSAVVVTLVYRKSIRISWDLRPLGKNTVRPCRPTRTSAHEWLFLLSRSSHSSLIHGEEGNDGELTSDADWDHQQEVSMMVEKCAWY